MKHSHTSSQNAGQLLSIYTTILTQGSCSCNGKESTLTTNDNSKIRFMEKVLLTDFPNRIKEPTRRKQIIIPIRLKEPSYPLQNLKSESIDPKKYFSNPLKLKSPTKPKLVLPAITKKQSAKRISPSKSNKIRHNYIPKTENENRSNRHIITEISAEKSPTRKDQNQSKTSVVDEKIIKSSRELVKMGIIKSMTRDKTKLKTISYNPFLKSLLNANKGDNEVSLITDHLMMTTLKPNGDNAKSTTYLLHFDKALNIKSFSIHGAFEGTGSDGSFIASYTKNTFSTLMTQSLTYDFRSSLIDSKSIYSAITKNDNEVLKDLWDKVKEIIAIANIDLISNSISFSIVFMIGYRVISMSYGSTQAIVLERKIDRDIEQFIPVKLSSENGKNELYIKSYFLTDESLSLVIGTSNLWDESRPYYNVIRVLSVDKMDIKDKAELLIQSRRKQAMIHRVKICFSFIILHF